LRLRIEKLAKPVEQLLEGIGINIGTVDAVSHGQASGKRRLKADSCRCRRMHCGGIDMNGPGTEECDAAARLRRAAFAAIPRGAEYLPLM
jgi:hypothetical protein